MPASYGIPAADGETGLLPWARVEARMAGARNYWVATTGPDGRPHAMPVWGIWSEDRLYFGTDRRSRKARNLAANHAVVVHLESGDDVVILDGVAREVTDPARRAAIDQAYFTKYAVRLTDHPGEVAIYSVRPHRAFAWQEADFPASATRWRLDDER
jgi:nitroimidazol reductase NimA-like FMN-containing flavoprotein (pyridoxamine 5'-phosphate oxidase superfamily)